MFLLEAVGENPFPSLSQIPASACIPQRAARSSTFKDSNARLSPFHSAVPTFLFGLPLLLLRTLVITLAHLGNQYKSPIWRSLISKFNSICNLNFSLPGNNIFTNSREEDLISFRGGCWTALFCRPHILSQRFLNRNLKVKVLIQLVLLSKLK